MVKRHCRSLHTSRFASLNKMGEIHIEAERLKPIDGIGRYCKGVLMIYPYAIKIGK